MPPTLMWRTCRFSMILMATQGTTVLAYLYKDINATHKFSMKELTYFKKLFQVTYSCDYLINCLKYSIQCCFLISICCYWHKSSINFMVFVVDIIRLRTWRMSHVLTFSLRLKDIQFQTHIESKWIDFFDMLFSFTHTPTTAINAYFTRYASTIKRVFQ